ncbi:uncharacterized protein LOC120414183 [Culex pipiens pallens]|uniref:uncharacterized protein LOC120414183 n=1 Tax=Culex pipiens pallens TaxID=42434 RepID=UPI0022AA6FD3|nr:uncharacterized protein LOC120414183 [Culex pipiens pallens]
MSGKTISARIDSRMPKTFRPRAVPQKPPAARCHSAEVSWTNSTAVDHRRPRTAAPGETSASPPKHCHRLGHVPAYLRRSQASSMDGSVSKLAGKEQERKPTVIPLVHKLGSIPAYLRTNRSSSAGEDREAKPVQKGMVTKDKKATCSSSEQNLVLEEVRSLRQDLRRSSSIGLFISPVDQSNVIKRLQQKLLKSRTIITSLEKTIRVLQEENKKLNCIVYVRLTQIKQKQHVEGSVEGVQNRILNLHEAELGEDLRRKLKSN